MKTKHTPGQWRVRLPAMRNGSYSVQTWCCGYVMSVADVVGFFIGPEQADANARLIAAAPELLEALDKIHRWLVCSAITTAEDMMVSANAMTEMARAAIAKATGGEG